MGAKHFFFPGGVRIFRLKRCFARSQDSQRVGSYRRLILDESYDSPEAILPPDLLVGSVKLFLSEKYWGQKTCSYFH